MSRIDLLPEHAIEKAIKDLEKEVYELKQVQYSGADVFVPKVNDTGNSFDLFSDTDFFGDQAIEKTITFTADHQPNVFATINVIFYDNAGNVIPLSSLDIVSINSLAHIPNDYQATFSVYAAKFGATIFKAKVYILASDTGSIGIS